MANKWLLSLLFLISITNMFWTNAEVTSCFQRNEKGRFLASKCSQTAKYACFRQDDIRVRYGCAHEDFCKLYGVICCLNDNCNKNL